MADILCNISLEMKDDIQIFKTYRTVGIKETMVSFRDDDWVKRARSLKKNLLINIEEKELDND